MRGHRFLPAHVSGRIIWAAIFTFTPYKAGDTLRRTSGKIDLAIAPVAMVVLVTLRLLARRKTGELMVKAEAAYPGPLE